MDHAEPTADQLRLFWDRAGVLFCIVGPDRRIACVNQAWTDLLGWREDQLLGRLPEEFLHPDDVPATRRVGFTDLGDEQRMLEHRTRCRHADGSVRWIQWSGHLRDGYWFGVGRDITAMHSAHRALQHSERRSRATLEALREGLVIVTPDRRIAEVNDRFAEMTGWSVRELIGRNPPYPWWPPEEYERADALLRAAARGEHGSRELTFMRRDGSRFPALVDEAPLVENAEGRPSTLSVVRDATELTDARDRLREAHEVARLSSWEWYDDDRVVIHYDGMRPETPPRYEVTGAQVLQAIAPDDRAVARRLRDEVSAGTREEFHVDLRVESAAIDVAWVEWRGQPLRGPRGSIVGVRGTAQDITARKRAELAAVQAI